MKRPSLAMLIGPADDPVDKTDDGGADKSDAAKLILKAIKLGDADMLSDALGSFLDIHCDAEEEPEPPEDGE